MTYEHDLCGAMLDMLTSSPLAVADVGSKVRSDWFQDPAMCAVFQAIVETACETEPGFPSLVMRCRNSPFIGERSGEILATLLEHRGNSPSFAKSLAESAAEGIATQAATRRVARIADAVTREIREGHQPDAVLTRMEEAINDIRSQDLSGTGGVLGWQDILTAFDSDRRSPVIPTGFAPFDNATEGGLPRGGLTILGAPPACGKSLFSIQLAVGAMLEDPELNVLYCKGEGTTQNLAFRLACLGDSLLGTGSVTMWLAKDRSKAATAAMARLTREIAGRFHVIEGELSTTRVLEAARRVGAGIVIVDYLQLLSDESASGSRVHALDSSMARFEAFAGVEGISIICLSSIAKSVGAQSRIGQISRDSASIDYAASLFYVALPTEDQLKEKAATGAMPLKWQCMKARNTAEVDLELVLDGKHQTFRDALASPPVEEFLSE